MNYRLKAFAMLSLFYFINLQTAPLEIGSTYTRLCDEITQLTTEEQIFFLNLNRWAEDIIFTTQRVEEAALNVIWQDEQRAKYEETCAPHRLLAWVGYEIGFWYFLDQKIPTLSAVAKQLLLTYRELILETKFDTEILDEGEMKIARTHQWELKVARIDSLLRERLIPEFVVENNN